MFNLNFTICQIKKHFKMYKSGKQWCVAALATLAITTGGILSTSTAHADTTSAVPSSAVEAVSTNLSANNEAVSASSSANSEAADVSSSSTSSASSSQGSASAEKATTVNVATGTNTSASSAAATAESSNTSSSATTTNDDSQPIREVKAAVSNTTNARFETKDGKVYYYDAENHMYQNQWYENWGNKYYFGDDGARITSATHDIDGDTYYFDNQGIMKSNYFLNQGGKVYYFDKDGKEYKNRFYSNWGNMYYFGKDGARYTNQYYSNWGHTYYFGEGGVRYTDRFYNNDGKLYYFDKKGIRLTNQWYQNWGNKYYFGADGARITFTTHDIDGATYYFDNQGIMKSDYFLNQGGEVYYFGKDGKEYKDQFYSNWGNMYYFGKDGARYTNQYYSNWGHTYYFGEGGVRYTDRFYNNDGKLYYFDKKGIRLTNQWYQNWGNKYYFGADGARITFTTHDIDGATYYFDNQGIMKSDYFLNQGGEVYYFGKDGKEYKDQFYSNWGNMYYFGKDGARYTNRFYQNWGHTYYFGDDGAALIGWHVIDGKRYNFASDGQLLGKLYGKIENDKLSIYYYDATSKSNKLLKTLDSGDWENLPYSFDSSSINNIDGYLIYAGWYRPYGTSQDGKTWYPTTVADWRPILMYVWPSKDVQVKFIQYFVNHGYENSNYGLTAGSVKDLSENTASIKLNEVAQNLRYVIEQHIVAAKSTSQLANDINNFINTIPELSASSELSLQSMPNYKPDESGTVDGDQVIFDNNDSNDQRRGNTSYADSKYRLMNRTINNQTGNDNSDNSSELLVGNDIDNSNPVVQAENLNWEYFLLNYGKLMGYNQDGNFDGFRIDAADNIDADVLDQMGQLMNDMYHMKGNPQNANNHLCYNEGYHSGAAQMLNKKGNPQLYMDAGEFYTLENVLGRANNRDTISNLITNSIVNRQNDVTENEATPNWSFVTNHDQRKNLINRLIIKDHPGIAYIMGSAYKAEYANQAWQEFYADQKKTDKQYAQYNVPAQYAILLSNKDTVPQIYYGDLYNENAQYMQEKSIYYDAITTLMKARKQFVSGGQTMTKLSDNLIASVRYGKGVANANSEGTDSLSRTSGMAVIVGNNPQMAEQTISINMGRAHANEQYRNLLDTTDDGLTYNADGVENPETLTTDDSGYLKVTVKGYSNPYVSGYLGVWVPVVSGNQDVTTNAATVSADSNKIFESNAALDSHMIYEDFSLYQPEPTSTENHAYNIIAQNAELFNNLGITDFWMAPAYTSASMSRYNEGYSVADRYNLGTNANPTKYGSGEELANAIAALHSAGLKVQEDIVMNQMIGFSGQEAVTVTRTNARGMQIYVNGKTYANQIYFAYTTGGGNGQETYGGKYLSELQSKYPDLFTTRFISTGVAPDPTTHITKWSAKYENGTSLQNIGIGLAVKLPNGDYAYLNDSNNKAFNTTLPETMSSADYYANIEDD
uniref:dextransucrase n=1 Tax=Limosilactobacillus fermentum TaxID=1613 RepID=A0A1Z2RUC3_LIMFE|nr:putative GTFB [Limosilactobacillus fermentum]